ncbi:MULTISPECIES: aspartyl-phosphate phosphatase Spo0E family protein [Bacillus]|uniref:Aspartyl-phosphate phosphatase Spo0E family protein n=1 Tax=Bacillus capparidis TaxID=1840411 RepID=A0ABS4CSQ9_9BACI|nr:MULTISPECIES: aspartyl-phosphate phosphatase Spo0E family protein [Bacillus]MBP1080128.1 hypothetical protein [Bacillus capparidis]MED1095514.1 aspartyl-phosphate phosphatase Spo0E family protein [Bacillus capparidis]
MTNKLLSEIEKKRDELLHVVKANGIKSPAVLEYSQQLDYLVLEYQKLHQSDR